MLSVLCGNYGFLDLLTLGPHATAAGVGFFSARRSTRSPCRQAKGIGRKPHVCALLPTGKSKKEDSAKEEKRKRDASAQLLKSAKPAQGSKSQQLLQPQQPAAPQAQQGGFSAHKEIKLTLLNKVRGAGGAIPSAPGVRGADGAALGLQARAEGELQAPCCRDELGRVAAAAGAGEAAHRNLSGSTHPVVASAWDCVGGSPGAHSCCSFKGCSRLSFLEGCIPGSQTEACAGPCPPTACSAHASE